MSSSFAAPTAIAISDNFAYLDLTLAQGGPVRLSAEQLRAACKCAHCIRARIDGRFPPSFGGVAIAELFPVGDYAINIVFSDGHARGIYPWIYLAELSAGSNRSGTLDP